MNAEEAKQRAIKFRSENSTDAFHEDMALIEAAIERASSMGYMNIGIEKDTLKSSDVLYQEVERRLTERGFEITSGSTDSFLRVSWS